MEAVVMVAQATIITTNAANRKQINNNVENYVEDRLVVNIAESKNIGPYLKVENKKLIE